MTERRAESRGALFVGVIMKKTMLKKYARAIVRIGANVQKGQSVRLDIETANDELAKYIVAECYSAGASKVRVNFSMGEITKLSYKKQSLKTLSKVSDWVEMRAKEEVDECIVRIIILSDDPDIMKGMDLGKIQKAQQAVGNVLKKYRDALEGKQQWVIAAAPSEAWAKKVFPGERTSVAVEKLWRAILATARIKEDTDPIDEWNVHNAGFKAKCDWLNSQGFEKLEYKSKKGTDLTVGLIPEAEFQGGGETTQAGIYFNPNMPTEEIFTSPNFRVCDGTVYSAMPLVNNGNVIDDFSITFKDGRAVSWTAKQGLDALEKIITMDEGSHYLGEVAIVPMSSPIRKTGILFYETLFDENASCHLALGRGFPNVIRGYESMTLDELHALGVNDSLTHVDFMIGDETLSITGVKANGERVEFFRDGEWNSGI